MIITIALRPLTAFNPPNLEIMIQPPQRFPTDFCRNIDNLAAFAREKCFKLTAAFEKLTYTDAGTNAPSKDVDQVVTMMMTTGR